MLQKLDQTRKLILLHLFLVICILEILPLWCFGICIATYSFKFFKQNASSFILRVASILALVATIAYYRTFFNPEAAVSFLALISSFKLLELNEKRDYIIGFLLAFLMIAAQALFFNSLFHFFAMFIGVLATLSLWWNLTSPNISIMKSIKYSISIFLISAPFVFILFTFFPRFSSHFLSFGRGETLARIGFSEDVKNDEIDQLQASTKIAFRAQFFTVAPPTNLMYWRGTIHTATDGFNWEKNYSLSVPVPIKKEFDSEFKYLVNLEQNFKGILFLLDRPQSLSLQGSNYTLFQDTEVARLNRFQKVNKYEGQSSFLKQSMAKVDKSNLLKLPKRTSERVIALAQRLKQGTNSAREFFDNLESYFIREGFLYTLAPGKMNSIDEFLFDRKKGFCTHYASVTAILARAAGIPSRLVSGFQGGEWNEYGQYFIIRDNDAHTWIEFINDDGYFTRYDPTGLIAPDRLTFGGQAFFNDDISKNGQVSSWKKFKSNFTKMNLFLDNINYQWSLLIESVDRDFQKQIASFMRLKLKRFYILSILFIVITPLFIMWALRLASRLNWSLFTFNKEQRLINKFIHNVNTKHNIEIKNVGLRVAMSLSHNDRISEGLKIIEELKFGLVKDRTQLLSRLSAIVKSMN